MLNEALQHLKAGETDKARDILTTVLRQDRDNLRAWGMMVQAARSDKERIFALKEVLRLKPGDPWASGMLADLEEAPAPPAPPAPPKPARLAPDPPRAAPTPDSGGLPDDPGGVFVDACLSTGLSILVTGPTRTAVVDRLHAAVPGVYTRMPVTGVDEMQVPGSTRPYWILPDVDERDCYALVERLNMRAGMAIAGIEGEAAQPAINQFLVMAGLGSGMTGERALAVQIIDTLPVLVEAGRRPDGSPAIIRIFELAGFNGTTIDLDLIFAPEGGELAPTGIVPAVYQDIRAAEVGLPESIFTEGLPDTDADTAIASRTSLTARREPEPEPEPDPEPAEGSGFSLLKREGEEPDMAAIRAEIAAASARAAKPEEPPTPVIDDEDDWSTGVPAAAEPPPTNWMEPPAAEVEEASSPAPPAEAARSGPSPIVVGLLVVVLLCLLTVLGGMIAVATGVVSIPGELSVETIDGGGAIDDFYDTARTESITVGGTGSGTIANEFDAHNWLLTVDGPQTITVRVEGTADTDPWLFVYDSAGNQLAENDDIDFDTYDSLVTVDLPAAGTYTLRVVTWGGGAYTISVQ